MDNFDDHSLSEIGETLIRSFGEYWARDGVDWIKQAMPGYRRNYKVTVKNPASKVKACDAWDQRGIYALYNDFKLVYVGLANSETGGIGSRLQAHHTKPRMQKRWDSFSWFGIDSYDANGVRIQYKEAKASGATIARTLELAVILIAAPPMNRSQGRFKGAEKIIQASDPEPEPSIKDLLMKLVEIKALLELKPR